MELFLSRMTILTRWLLVPLLIGLALALILAICAFYLKLLRMAGRITETGDVQLVVDLLTLIDLTLIGALIVIVIYSSYENFVQKIARPSSSRWPVWMSRISFSGLKLKLFGTMMAISGITLLKALMKLEILVSEAQVKWLAAANVIFIIAYVAIAFTDRFAGEDAPPLRGARGEDDDAAH